MQIEILYGLDLILIVSILIVFLTLSGILGRFLGRWEKKVAWMTGEESNFTPSTILGLLALVLGFTFSMAVARFDSRRTLVVQEANAIGTAYLRSDLLPDNSPQILKPLIKNYLDVRIQFHGIKGDRNRASEVALRTEELQGKIWELVMQTSRSHNNPLMAITVAAMNDMFDASSERTYASTNRIPELVYFLLFLVAGIGVASLGFMEGLRKDRSLFNVVVLSILFALVIGAILDIDRPQRGFIQNNQLPLLELRDSLER
jgi:hypothetical protein